MDSKEVHAELGLLQDLVNAGIVDVVIERLGNIKPELTRGDYNGLVITLQITARSRFHEVAGNLPAGASLNDIQKQRRDVLLMLVNVEID